MPELLTNTEIWYNESHKFGKAANFPSEVFPPVPILNANTQLDLEWSYWGYPVISPGHMTDDLKIREQVAPAYQDP